MLLKILTHSMAGSVTFCFDGCFVKCFQHVSSAIIPYQMHISSLRNGYSTIRRNCKNKMLCRQKDIVIFVGGAFSLDMSICVFHQALDFVRELKLINIVKRDNAKQMSYMNQI